MSARSEVMMLSGQSDRLIVFSLWGCLLGLLSLGAARAQPVLHEYFDARAMGAAASNSSASNSSRAATGSGMPERLATASGSADAPSLARPNPSAAYASGAERGVQRYQLDNDTSRPDVVGYSDPFTPAIPPFKRLFAYDTVTPRLELAVEHTEPSAVKIGGAPRPGEDQFYADINLLLTPGKRVRIPSVGPQSRVLAARLTPQAPFQLHRDSADNWFVESPNGGAYRLVMHLVVDRRVFGSTFGDVSWQELQESLPSLPPELEEQTLPVRNALGVGDFMAPAEVVRRLIAHFRDFQPAEERLGSSGAMLYRDVALTRRGVCRHRSFAFVVTALSIGIPSRFVRNEAHAWVEVFDGALWHRVDLGGAAGRIEVSSDVQLSHVSPNDPYHWPPNSETGLDTVNEALVTAGSSRARRGSTPLPTPGPQSTTTPSGYQPGLAATAESQEMLAVVASSAVSLAVETKEATRGGRIVVAGRVSGDGRDCGLLRVEIALEGESGQRYPVGMLVTDGSGLYRGEIVVSSGVPVGDYDVLATTPGNRACGAGSSN